MAEEGTGGQGINIGVSVENDAVPKAMRAIQRELDQMERGFRQVQQTAAQGADQTVAKLREVGRASEDVGRAQATGGAAVSEAFSKAGAGIGNMIAGFTSLGAVSAQIWARIREDIEKTTALAKESVDVRKSFGAAGNARPGFAPEMTSRLRGTMWADPEGAAMAAQVAAEAPRKMSAADLSSLLVGAQKYVGLMGSREGAAGVARDAAVVYDKFGGKISPDEANAYALSLRNAGMQNVAEWNTPVQNLITAGIPAERAFGIAAGAAESDLGTKTLKSLAGLLGTEMATGPMPKTPSGTDMIARMKDRGKRLEFILGNPGMFGFEGDKLREMMSATDMPTVAGAMARFGQMQYGDPDQIKTQMEAELGARETSVRQRDIQRSWASEHAGRAMKVEMDAQNMNWANQSIARAGRWMNENMLGMDPGAAAIRQVPNTFGTDRNDRVGAVMNALGATVYEPSVPEAFRAAQGQAILTRQDVNVTITVKSANGSGVDARAAAFPASGS